MHNWGRSPKKSSKKVILGIDRRKSFCFTLSSMGNHRSTDYNKQIARAKELGCEVIDTKNDKKKIFYPVGSTPHPRYGTMYYSHAGVLGVKPLERFLDFLDKKK